MDEKTKGNKSVKPEKQTETSNKPSSGKGEEESQSSSIPATTSEVPLEQLGASQETGKSSSSENISAPSTSISAQKQLEASKKTEESQEKRHSSDNPIAPSTSIILPNQHLCITIVTTVITVFIVHIAFYLHSPNFSTHQILQQLQKECLEGNTIMCIKDKLQLDAPTEQTANIWVEQIMKVYVTSEEFGSALLTLKSVHDDMTQDPHMNLKNLKINVSDIQHWKGDVINQLKSQDVKLGEVDVQSMQKQLDIKKLQESVTILSGDLSSVMVDVNDIQDKELPDIRGDIEKTNKTISDLIDKAVLNHTKTEEALWGQVSKIMNMGGRIQTLDGRAKKQMITLEKLNVKVNEDRKYDDKKFKIVNGDLDTQRTKLAAVSVTVENHKEKTEARFSKHETKIVSIEGEAIPDLQKEIQKAISNAETAGNQASASQKDISNYKVWASERQSEYETFRKDLEFKHGQTFFTQSVSQERIEQLKNKEIFHDIGFYLGLFSIGCCVLMFMNSMKKKQTGWSTDMKTTKGKEERITQGQPTRPCQPKHRYNIDVYQMKWKGPIENSVCVVTFHSETDRQHTAETKSVFVSGGAILPVIHTRVIRRHTDIQDLPGSRVFLVFIDFNERNIILEDPNKGLGDLRVTTVRSLWKFGGDVTVIYCRDQGSRQLGEELFNRDLSSINSQPELSKLKSQQRMLSIFEGFSDYQKEHCRDFINRQLKLA